MKRTLKVKELVFPKGQEGIILEEKTENLYLKRENALLLEKAGMERIISALLSEDYADLVKASIFMAELKLRIICETTPEFLDVHLTEAKAFDEDDFKYRLRDIAERTKLDEYNRANEEWFNVLGAYYRGSGLGDIGERFGDI